MEKKMKSLIFVLSLVSVFAMAKSSPVYQRIGNVPANELCDAGTVFKTLKPVFVCDQWQETPGVIHGEIFEPAQWTCVASHYEHQDISKEISVCLEMEISEETVACKKMGKGIQSSTVVVEEKVKHVKDNFKYDSYTIPACE
jgi:hypothetical protein